MRFVPVMWTIWGLLVVISVAIFMYRSMLSRDEDDQIYLDDAFQHERAAQEAIVAKVNRIEPALRLSTRIAGAATVVVIVYYIFDSIRQFK